MPAGMLIDTTRCTGCRGCQAACKQWNLLPATETSFNPSLTNPIQKNAYTYNTVEFFEVEDGGKFNFITVHKRCFHCSDPACVSVCPVGALQKFENGPVVWDKTRCFGCRYCQNACPFQIPKFEWDKNWPQIAKCTFCWNRINQPGQQPACAKTCPPKAIQFGERADMLAEAYRRMAANPERYHPYVYGEHEAGGTSVMYISAVPPEKLGFLPVEKEFYPPFTWEFLGRIPLEIAGIAAILAGAWFVRSRQTSGHKEEATADKAE